ncbi:MAG: hypothetical protein IKN49_06740 [Elusimicrobiaceae bacterium]|nr:hypothetical protein [Elusimicrobiaceae bacterium]
MNDLQIFKNREFGEIRTIQEDEVIWFCGADVCKALGFANTADGLRKHCKMPGIVKRYTGVQTGIKADGSPAIQQIPMLYINEPNLYRLIVHSRLPSAEKFEKWVFEEVLPTIRKTGNYAPALKNASVGEVVSLIRVTRETMQDQGKTPEEIATVLKDIGQQFGIRLSRWVVEPEQVNTEDLNEAVDYVFNTYTPGKGKRKPKYEKFLVHVSVRQLEGGKQ